MMRWILAALVVAAVLAGGIEGVMAGATCIQSDNASYPLAGWIYLESTNTGFTQCGYYYTGGASVRILGARDTVPGTVSMHVKGVTSIHSAQTVPISNTLNFTYNWHQIYATIQSTSGTSAWAMLYFFPPGAPANRYHVSGITGCVGNTQLYLMNDTGNYRMIEETSEDSYSFTIMHGFSYRLAFDDTYYDFICTGDEVFNYDTCIYVYGYTCNIEHVKLYKDGGGWVLEDTYYQTTIGANLYEMVIESGNDYKLEFSDGHEYLFSCTGDHVLYDWDRCPWAYPPNGGPVQIIIYAGYDNRIVLLQDAHGNFIEHSQVAVYDQTDDIYLQKWTDNPEGYLSFGARFDTDHDVQIAVRTFDSVYTTTTVYPMNGTAENLTWTNWTIPIMYNIWMEPVDTYNVPLFDVFCGLAEYTPINPLAFWGMDFNRGYVPVTNCSGFSRCDIIAEKGGYEPYEATGLNWTSKSAMTKDYRHEIVMVKE